MVRMNKNSVGPQQRVEMRVLPYWGGSLCFSLLWLDHILEPKQVSAIMYQSISCVILCTTVLYLCVVFLP